jgi:hypothetical protein
MAQRLKTAANIPANLKAAEAAGIKYQDRNNSRFNGLFEIDNFS